MPFRPAVALIALCLLGLPASGALPEPVASTALSPWTADVPPPLGLTDLAGVERDLHSMHGRTVVVHFFATWCEPCIPELAALERFRSRAGGEQLAVVAVGVGEGAVRLRRFFAGRPAAFTVLPDPDRRATRAWRVEVLPATFILDGDLKPRFAAEGDVDWDGLDPAALAALVGP
ncbi:MAG: TlpA family protein disulfide reductase [Alphaproteobacteria bacterium]